MRRIYIASSWKQEGTCVALGQTLRANGLQVYCFCDPGVFRFWWPDILRPEDDAITALDLTESQEGFRTDKAGLDWANCCLLVVPSGRDSHLEAGYMKGKGAELYIWGFLPVEDVGNMYHLADGLFRPDELSKLIGVLLA